MLVDGLLHVPGAIHLLRQGIEDRFGRRWDRRRIRALSDEHPTMNETASETVEIFSTPMAPLVAASPQRP